MVPCKLGGCPMWWPASPPFANIGGFVFKWETAGNSTSSDLGLARLIAHADPFGHLRTYEEENVTISNNFRLPEWTFASVEALGSSCVAPSDRPGCHGYKPGPYAAVQNHHDVSLQAYAGKPVYMCEGHDLWRSWWQAEEPNVVRAAWAVTTAAASWTWSDMGNAWNDTYSSKQTLATYPAAAMAVDALAHIMTEVVPAFYRMVPADELLVPTTTSGGGGGGGVAAAGALATLPVPPLTFCLAEHGAQYVLYSDEGRPFTVNLSTTTSTHRLPSPPPSTSTRTFFNVTWYDPETGKPHSSKRIAAGIARMQPPTQGVHWVAVVLAV